MNKPVLLTVAVEFAAAHSVKAIERCAGIHGHTWRAEVTVRKPIDQNLLAGDFAEFKAAIRGLGLDHANLNDLIGTANATCEAVAIYVYGQLGQHPLFGGDLVSVTIAESPTARVTIGG